MLPVDILQTFFASLDPALAQRKFRRFAAMDPDSDEARVFVAMEDWLNEGPPLAAGVARTCFFEWYQENRPAQGTWRLGDTPMDPAAVRQPCLVASPRDDRLVPPASSMALYEALPDAELLTPAAGHIGMVAGGGAEPALWRPLLDWLAARS